MESRSERHRRMSPQPHITVCQRMGSALLKKRVRSWSWTGSPGQHSPYPVDVAPYPGQDCLYCFLDLMLSYNIIFNRLNLGHQAVTTRVEDYMEDLIICYQNGFILNEFTRIPGISNTTEIQDWAKQQPYQAILSKPSQSTSDETKRWELKIEKRILSTRMLSFEEIQDENDLVDTIKRYAAVGARLVCAEPAGYVHSDSANKEYAIMGVDLFFNMPKHKNPKIYTYHTVKLKAHYLIIRDATQTVQKIVCNADFLGQMKAFLDQGWKLIDICMDQTAMAEAFRMSSPYKTIDTIWIFEKEEEKLNDLTPKYEGVIIEYLHKVKKGIGGEMPCKDWRPVIAGMGISGWELACIIQTPALVQSSFTTYTMKLLMLFQRKLLTGFEKLKKLRAKSISKQPQGAGATSGAEGTSKKYYSATRNLTEGGYYHHTLKRFVYEDDPLQQTVDSDNRPSTIAKERNKPTT